MDHSEFTEESLLPSFFHQLPHQSFVLTLTCTHIFTSVRLAALQTLVRFYLAHASGLPAVIMILLSLPNMSFRSFLKANEPLHQSLLWPEPLFLRCCGTLVFVLHHLHARLLIDWLKEEKCSNTWTSRLNGPIKTFKLKVLEDMGHVL